MKKLLALTLALFPIIPVYTEPIKTNERFDLLIAIKSGDRDMVEAFCKNDRSLDVSRQLASVDDTPVHLAIRALVSEYEKQADYAKTLKNFGLWSFIAASVGGITYFYKDRMWQPVAGARAELLSAPDMPAILRRLASLSGNVLLMTTAGTLMYMALRKLYFAGQTLMRDNQHMDFAKERQNIVELLIEHPSFDPNTVNSEGLTPLGYVIAEREKLHPDNFLARILLSLEDQLMAKTRRSKTK